MKVNQITIVSKDNPWAQGLSYDELAAFSASADADVNPITSEIVHAQPLGYVAVGLSDLGGECEPVKAIGYAGHSKNREYKGELYPQLGTVVVLPEFQGFGLGLALVDKTFEAMQQSHAKIVAVANHLSSGIFSKLGFDYVDDVVSDSGLLKPLYMFTSGQE